MVNQFDDQEVDETVTVEWGLHSIAVEGTPASMRALVARLTNSSSVDDVQNEIATSPVFVEIKTPFTSPLWKVSPHIISIDSSNMSAAKSFLTLKISRPPFELAGSSHAGLIGSTNNPRV